MSLSTRLLRSKDTYSREAVADLLATLAERIRSGTVTFDQDGNSLDIEVPDTVRLDIEIKDTPKDSGTKRELELELWWITGADGQPGPTGGVTIS
ncbi:amphi-Trp domain-containing protein [Dietzia sp. SLG310A2-38A2]|uniref:amphi-Trp domain-containing protein n=1 Tax=Dietzia sp. SLG310A2-38A2 TaxID=1630643 RepID=UPI0015FC879E|nr:amphi-Trp domain-containing protein [Dietzia sp. SLG310A2-38A2]MBB1030251.1 amphi-Trp domain-containing protein [Dietzia sp. SLG310A2-38A2]